MAGVVAAPPYTWCPHSTSINTDTFVLITSQSSAMYRPFICRCRTPMFLHYNTVYTIHFSLYATDNSHSMTNTGVSQHRLSYQCFRSCSRIKRDVYINRNSICVLVCVFVFLAVWPLQAVRLT